MVQSPFYPRDGACHLYLLHPPGGIAGGDRLSSRLSAGPRTKVLITTPAATKFYRTTGSIGQQNQLIVVQAGASFEFLPQENLVFDGARARSITRIELSPEARFFGWETWGLGRPARGEHFQCGDLNQTLDIRVDGTPVLIERMRLDTDDSTKLAAWGLQERGAFSTAYAYPAGQETLELARRCLDQPDGVSAAGATLLDNLLVVRALAEGTQSIIDWQRALWAELRPNLLGLKAIPPRIWAT